MPPLPARVALYGVPTWPFGSAVVVITSAAGATVSVRVVDWLSAGLLESVTLKVSDTLLAACVGVPVIAPVDGVSTRPAGSVPVRDHVYGFVPPVAARVAL